MSDQNKSDLQSQEAAAPKHKAPTVKQQRDLRLSQALRDNLRRRKVQTKGRKSLMDQNKESE